MQGGEEEPMILESGGHSANLVFGGVIEMAPRAENFDGLETRFGDLAEEFRRQLSRNKQISGKMSLHEPIHS